MALRFFADHCVSNFIINSLREAGHTVLLLKEYLAVESTDAAVIGKGQELDAILRSEERRVGKECRSRWSPYH